MYGTKTFQNKASDIMTNLKKHETVYSDSLLTYNVFEKR